MEPEGPAGTPSLPRGPHPTVGPDSVGMPQWPGVALTIGGAVLAIGALSVATLVADGRIAMANTSTLAWLALIGALAFVAGVVYVSVRQIRVRRFLGPERYRGPAVLLLLALVFVLAAVVNAPFTGDILALTQGDGDLTLLGATVILVSTQAALLLVTWLFVVRPNALSGVWNPGPDPAGAARSGLLWGIVAWVGATALGALAVLVLEALGMDLDPQAAEQAVTLLEPWLVVPAVVILAPIAEEIFFRGVVFNAWRREGGRRWAYIGSAALFAVIHLSWASVVPIFALGLALAWAYERTGSLVAPIVMHAVVNGISVALVLLSRFDVIQLPV